MAKLRRATRDALARRGVRAAEWIESLAERLEREIEKAGVDKGPIPIGRDALWRTIREMRDLVERIRQFSDRGEV